MVVLIWAITILYFVYFQIILQNTNCSVCQIRTRIVRVEGKHVDYLTTTTTAPMFVAFNDFFHYPHSSSLSKHRVLIVHMAVVENYSVKLVHFCISSKYPI